MSKIKGKDAETKQVLSAEDKAAINLFKVIFQAIFTEANIKTVGYGLTFHVKELSGSDLVFLGHAITDSNSEMRITCKRSGTGISVFVDLNGMR